jgi:hypothetical protein
MRFNILLLLAQIVVLSSLLLAESCPAGSYVLRVERSGDEERTICKCLAGLLRAEAVASQP